MLGFCWWEIRKLELFFSSEPTFVQEFLEVVVYLAIVFLGGILGYLFINFFLSAGLRWAIRVGVKYSSPSVGVLSVIWCMPVLYVPIMTTAPLAALLSKLGVDNSWNIWWILFGSCMIVWRLWVLMALGAEEVLYSKATWLIILLFAEYILVSYLLFQRRRAMYRWAYEELGKLGEQTEWTETPEIGELPLDLFNLMDSPNS